MINLGQLRTKYADDPAVMDLVAECRKLRDVEVKQSHEIIERLATAGYRLMKIAGGADIEPGEMQFACKEGMFSEEIAGCSIRALRRSVADLQAKLSEAEAGAAAMRELLDDAWGIIFEKLKGVAEAAKRIVKDKPGEGSIDWADVEMLRAALAEFEAWKGSK